METTFDLEPKGSRRVYSSPQKDGVNAAGALHLQHMPLNAFYVSRNSAYCVLASYALTLMA